MEFIKNLPGEILGLFILITAEISGKYFLEVSDFWLALATAFFLFLLMHIRTHMGLSKTAKEKPSP